MTSSHNNSISDKIVVWLIDDDDEIHMSLSLSFKRYPTIYYAQYFASCRTALSELHSGKSAPDVILLDIAMPGISGIDAIHLFRHLCPTTKLIVITGLTKVDTLLCLIQKQVDGIVYKPFRVSKIVDSIHDSLNGGIPIDSLAARHLIDRAKGKPPKPSAFESITSKEREIIEFATKGFTIKEIGIRMHLSSETVHTYMKRIYVKLYVHNRVELTNLVVRPESEVTKWDI